MSSIYCFCSDDVRGTVLPRSNTEISWIKDILNFNLSGSIIKTNNYEMPIII
jgi:hypothetical protein